MAGPQALREKRRVASVAAKRFEVVVPRLQGLVYQPQFRQAFILALPDRLNIQEGNSERSRFRRS